MLRRTAQFSKQAARSNHRISFTPDPVKGEAFRSYQEHVVQHAKGTTTLWRNISFLSLPLLAVCAYYVVPKEIHHVEHMEALVKLPDDQWPVEMDYQNMRHRKFFWGDKSLFWGPTNHQISKE
ncbi:cytochrome c oxidase subunit VIa [Starmerella bacillaris]|uniref:Cytochrome c oxidase subunit VIa n=1 Tax=Starmerella bacillaris TaxID=1247836 RepID=A0AAV5RFD3_STABA|nr:cytochrome c oxidase subunit VIa [Starmerella bacillaris]